MPILNPSQRSGATHYKWTPPTILLRGNEWSKVRSNSGVKGGQGNVIGGAKVLGYERAPLPFGGRISFRIPTQYAINTSIDVGDRTDYRGTWFSLVRKEGKREVTEMRGRLMSEEFTFSTDNNGINYHVNQAMEFRDAPIRVGRTGLIDVGKACTWFDQGYWDEVVYSSEGGNRLSPRGFERHPMTFGSDGEPMSRMDEFLLEETAKPGRLDWSGQPFADVYSELIHSAYGGKWLPTLRYDGLVTVVTAVEKGTRSKRLVVGPVGVTDPSYSLEANVLSITGMDDYQNLYNQVVGIGSEERTVTTTQLIPAWTSAEESAVLADKGLLGTRAYEHVGRAYKLTDRGYVMNPVPFGSISKGGRDEPRFFKSADSGATWFDDGVQPELRTVRRDGSTSGLGIDRADLIHPRYGDQTVLWWNEPLLTREGDGFQSVKTNMVKIGDEIRVYSESFGDYPYDRLKLIRDETKVREIEGSYYLDESGSAVATYTGRDDRPGFQTQLNRVAEVMARPENIRTVTLWYYDPDWFEGDAITQVIDTERTDALNLSENPWYVERVLHDLQEYRTTLLVSNVFDDLNSVGLAI